jgi:hypothetical protein
LLLLHARLSIILQSERQFQCSWSSTRIVPFGRSLGGSIAAHLAGQVEARALGVESSFTSYPDMGARMDPCMPVRLFARFRYDTRAQTFRGNPGRTQRCFPHLRRCLQTGVDRLARLRQRCRAACRKQRPQSSIINNQ